MQRTISSLFLILFLTTGAISKEIKSKEEYDRVIRNAERLTKDVTPTIHRWGAEYGDNYEWVGDGFTLNKDFKYGALTSSFVRINNTDTTQTCWSHKGQEWKRHWAKVYDDWMWIADGPDGQIHLPAKDGRGKQHLIYSSEAQRMASERVPKK